MVGTHRSIYLIYLDIGRGGEPSGHVDILIVYNDVKGRRVYISSRYIVTIAGALQQVMSVASCMRMNRENISELVRMNKTCIRLVTPLSPFKNLPLSK